MAVQTLKIELLGASFTIQTDESREYLEALLAHIRRRTEDVRRATRVTDPLKISILASIYLADELFREREKRASGDVESEELGRAADRLIERLERALVSMDEGGPSPDGGDSP